MKKLYSNTTLVMNLIIRVLTKNFFFLFAISFIIFIYLFPLKIAFKVDFDLQLSLNAILGYFIFLIYQEYLKVKQLLSSVIVIDLYNDINHFVNNLIRDFYVQNLPIDQIPNLYPIIDETAFIMPGKPVPPLHQSMLRDFKFSDKRYSDQIKVIDELISLAKLRRDVMETTVKTDISTFWGIFREKLIKLPTKGKEFQSWINILSDMKLKCSFFLDAHPSAQSKIYPNLILILEDFKKLVQEIHFIESYRGKI